ncbi:MAG: ribose 5-phosphate isomerase B [Clostridiales Family XIII bacterium]|jgi:ribose 5-phosphate isomerase B|nr:ribose 5-phosphate isomerase B [Clostridiales Family XIII bacterium]
MKIALASDHGGVKLKEQIKGYLAETGIEAIELGTNDEQSVDYPEYGQRCAEYVTSGLADRGIVLCGTGIGMCIAANKVQGARCALLASDFMAEMAKAHNDANLIALGGRTTSYEDAIRWIGIWLNTEVCGDRHARRRQQLDAM